MSTTSDKVAIREVLDTWVVARDSGLWDPLLNTWHEDGRMRTTWFRGAAPDFVAACRRGFDQGTVVHHFLGGTMIELDGTRAIAQTKMTIGNRLLLDGVECDLTCTGLFYDFLEQRDGRWAIVLRQPIYEKDRADPVDPSETLAVAPELLASFPPGCRWLQYAQQRIGLAVIGDQIDPRGAGMKELYEAGAGWLQGQPAPAD